MMTPVERFMEKVMPIPECGCWFWMGAQDGGGYGLFHYNGNSTFKAHRASYELFVGPIINGLHVLHKCDQRICVNPAHLYAGTPTQNMADKYERSKPNHARGERHPMAKLSKSDVQSVRDIYRAGGISQRALASQFGVRQGTISFIVSETTWKNQA